MIRHHEMGLRLRLKFAACLLTLCFKRNVLSQVQAIILEPRIG